MNKDIFVTKNEKIHDPKRLNYSLGTKPICNLCGKEYASNKIYDEVEENG